MFALKRFRIFFSNLFESQSVSTLIINACTAVAVLCCHGGSCSYIPTSKVIRSCSYGYISPKTSLLFNLAFQMKCKYFPMCAHVEILHL